MTPLLELADVHVAYRNKRIVRNVSFALEEGSIGCLLGPSGCGKTTLLRAIAGFEPVTGGRIVLHGRTVSIPGYTLAPEARHIGMVFQDFALFPHLSVVDNVRFGLRGLSQAGRRVRARELLAMVGLSEYARYYPHQLSGGQQQRVALVRALAPRPQLLMLDEPFSSMDIELREALAGEVRGILKREGITAMLVTHDQHEAFAMADEIGVLQTGELQQWDTGYRLYHEPANRFVADFIGQGVLLPGRVLDGRQVSTELGVVRGRLPDGSTPESAVEVLIRPDDVIVEEASALRGEVIDQAFRGSHFLYTLQLPGGGRILLLTPSHQGFQTGEQIGIRLAVERVVMFPLDRSDHGSLSMPVAPHG
jgi:iron(III) transport system ATP-binding protein